jgi:hypothetical protein
MWREVPGIAGYYATKDGKVARRLRTKFREGEYKLLKPYYQKGSGGGMLTFYHPKTGSRTYRKVAQVILETYGKPRPSKGYWAMHKNGKTRDNRFDNLEWRAAQPIQVRFEMSTTNYRTVVRGKDIGSWPSETAAWRAGRKYLKTGAV